MNFIFFNDENMPTITSIQVAENFGKRHDNVMRQIRNIIETLESPDNTIALNFEVLNSVQ